MKLERKESRLEPLRRETRVMPETFNEEKRTVDVVWTTGARVERSSWWEGRFIEELSLKKSDVRLERLQNGASVLNNHRGGSLSDVIAVVENASIRNGEGIATIRFSEREDVEPIMRDVKDGIIRHISVGYRVHKFQEKIEKSKEPDVDDVRVLRAVDWEPMELSFVTIPADPGAQVRSGADSERAFNCIIEKEVEEMDPTKADPTKAPANPEQRSAGETKTQHIDAEKVRAEAVASERKRVADINEAVRLGGLESDVAEKLIADGVSIDEARAQILSQVAAKQKETSQRTSIEVGAEERDHTRTGMISAMGYRLRNAGFTNKGELDDAGKRFANMSLMDMARHVVGDRDYKLSRSQVVQRAFHSTSDFPLILEDTVRKTLRDSYAELPITFEPFTRRTTTPDFKEISRVRLSDVDGLVERPEGAEYQGGTTDEEGEKYRVKGYGRLFTFTREMLINDDLDAFGRLPQKYGRAARRLESDQVWGVITGNPNMADGFALFSDEHDNLNDGAGGAGAALSETTLALGRKLMRLHKDLRGEPLNISPMILAVPAALETSAQKLITSVTPDSAANVNPFSFLSLVVEPRLDAASATAFYLMASLAMTDMVELATLEGEAQPDLAREDDIKTDGICWRVRHEIGVAPIDFRGLYKNEGA